LGSGAGSKTVVISLVVCQEKGNIKLPIDAGNTPGKFLNWFDARLLDTCLLDTALTCAQ
jgi:hypothetical protein